MQHLAIIMDGNRRWAHENRLSVVYGHDKGAQTLSEISREVAKLKIPFLTVFAFSSENWRRSKAEVNALFGLMRRYLKQEMSNLMSENIKLRIIGDITPFPKDLQTLFKNAEIQTEHNNSMTLTIAVNYGGLQDIVNAGSKFDEENPDLFSDEVLEKFKSKLMTSFLPPVDMLIRTGKEKRISNFLIWDCAYAELYFSDSYWPDFDVPQLHNVIKDWNSRVRRFGGSVNEKTKEIGKKLAPIIKERKKIVNER